MNNDDSKKELVGRTYAGVDGYCPIAIYLGILGYCLKLALRTGVQHSGTKGCMAAGRRSDRRILV